ncbi:nose resistant to fluoxetine protein 6 isoform X2 [Neocloeon triangulifer]|uniref:nose resistant to fluoxetine protein 6 isoform X2 n=1 Tax=Neocloeon triangulifer TaxID=2078957 RepID=UPI00286F1012|nr:nose resistant to fluoxetine protein 6 isoform X2 [Neocloeon triangulifer]
MRRILLLVCIAAAHGQPSVKADDEGSGHASEFQYQEPQRRYSPNFQNLLHSMTSFNPTFNASGKCGEHSRIAKAAANNLELWALQMFDSTGRVPPSLLNGNVNQYGDFDQCLQIEHTLSESGETIKGQYALAFLDLQVRDQEVADLQIKHLLALAHSYDVIRSNFSDPGHRIPRYSTINWGICVPSTCSAKDIEQGLKKALAPLSDVPEFRLAIKVDEQMMYKAQIFSPDATTCLVICLFLVLISTVIIASLVDISDKEVKLLSKWKRMLLAFSLRRTWAELINTKSASDDISPVHGLRFINALGLLLCHKSMALFFYPYINRTVMTMRFTKPWTVMGRTAILYTDSFIVISGMLVAYSFVKELDKKGNLSFKSKLKSRFLRISPNFVAIILFCTYILQLMGSGPQWNLVVKHYSDICKSHMWKNFLFIHNYFGFENMCLTHTHQLGIDMQLFAVSPVLIYLLWKWPRGGSTVLILIASFSTWLRFSVTLNNELSSIIYFGNTVKKMFDTCNKSYILPSHRLTVYIMGILTGFYLRRNPKGIKFTLTTELLTWAFIGLICIYPWFSPYHMSRLDYRYNVWEAANYAAWAPILWSLFIICLIFVCHKRGGWVGAFMRWRGFLIFTKISYAVYLTQFPIYFYNVGTTKFAGHSNMSDLFVISEVLTVLVASVVLTLLVDLPFQEIKKILTEKDLKEKIEPDQTVAVENNKVKSSASCRNSGSKEERESSRLSKRSHKTPSG